MQQYMYNVIGVSLHCMPLDHKLKVSTKHLRIAQSLKSKCKLAQVFKIAVQDLKSERVRKSGIIAASIYHYQKHMYPSIAT